MHTSFLILDETPISNSNFFHDYLCPVIDRASEYISHTRNIHTHTDSRRENAGDQTHVLPAIRHALGLQGPLLLPHDSLIDAGCRIRDSFIHSSSSSAPTRATTKKGRTAGRFLHSLPSFSLENMTCKQSHDSPASRVQRIVWTEKEEGVQTVAHQPDLKHHFSHTAVVSFES